MKPADLKKIFRNLPDLKTHRLILRKMRLTDAKDMHEYAGDPMVSRYMVWVPHKTFKHTVGFLKYVQKTYRQGEPESWAVTIKSSGKMIGTCGFYKVDPRHSFAELAYAISRDYWGRGLMTEAVKAVLDFGFRKLKLNRISANAMPENIGSINVMKKNGMKYEGTLRELLMAKGKFRTVKLYSILKKEWKRK